MNHKNLIVVLIVIVLLLSGAVAYLLAAKKAEAPANLIQAPSSQATPQTNLPAQTAPVAQNSLVYTNTDYGFRLKLPEGFENYKTMVEKEPFEKGKSYVFVMLPTTYKNWIAENRETHEKILGYENIFGITVWDRALWYKELEECKENPYPACPFEPQVLGKTAKYVFEIALGNGDPTPDLEQMEVKIRANDAKIIKDTFELIK